MSRLACQLIERPAAGERRRRSPARPRSCSSSASSPSLGSSSFRSAVSTFSAGSKRRSAVSEPARSCRSTASFSASDSCVSSAEPEADKLRLRSRDRRREHDLRQRDAVDDDLERRRRHAAARSRPLRTATGRRNTVTSAARSTSMSSMRLKQRRARPRDLDAVEPQPHAIAVGDGDRLDRRMPGERALETRQRDSSVGRRERIFEEADEAGLVVAVLGKRRADRQRDRGNKGREEDRERSGRIGSASLESLPQSDVKSEGVVAVAG